MMNNIVYGLLTISILIFLYSLNKLLTYYSNKIKKLENEIDLNSVQIFVNEAKELFARTTIANIIAMQYDSQFIINDIKYMFPTQYQDYSRKYNNLLDKQLACHKKIYEANTELILSLKDSNIPHAKRKSIYFEIEKNWNQGTKDSTHIVSEHVEYTKLVKQEIAKLKAAVSLMQMQQLPNDLQIVSSPMVKKPNTFH